MVIPESNTRSHLHGVGKVVDDVGGVPAVAVHELRGKRVRHFKVALACTDLSNKGKRRVGVSSLADCSSAVGHAPFANNLMLRHWQRGVRASVFADLLGVMSAVMLSFWESVLDTTHRTAP